MRRRRILGRLVLHNMDSGSFRISSKRDPYDHGIYASDHRRDQLYDRKGSLKSPHPGLHFFGKQHGD